MFIVPLRRGSALCACCRCSPKRAAETRSRYRSAATAPTTIAIIKQLVDALRQREDLLGKVQRRDPHNDAAGVLDQLRQQSEYDRRLAARVTLALDVQESAQQRPQGEGEQEYQRAVQPGRGAVIEQPLAR